MMVNRKQFALAAAVMSVALASQSQGATYNWVSGTTWDTAVWTSSDGGTTYPQSAGDVANVNADITTNTDLALPSGGIALGSLNIGDVNGSNAFSLSGGPLAFQMPSGAATLTLGTTGTLASSFSGAVSLSSSLMVNAGTQRMTTGGTFSTNGNNITLTGGTVNNATWELNGDLIGSGTITLNTTGGLRVNGTKSFNGTLVINSGMTGSSNAGSVSMYSGSIRNAQHVVINGAVSGGTTQAGGSLQLGNGENYTTTPGQRSTEHKLSLNSGSFNPHGQGALAGSDFANDNQVESLGTLRFNSGFSVVSSSKGGSLSYTMTIGGIERGAGATGYVRANPLGDTVKLLVTNMDSSFLKGAGTAAGTTTMSIIPWMAANSGGASTGTPSTFATYVDGVGLRALSTTTTESATSIAAGATANVNNGGGFTLTSNRTVNSLRIAHNTSNLAGYELTITSGGLFISGSRTVGGTTGGTVNFGSAEGVIWSNTSDTSSFDAIIAGSGGLTKAGTGTLVLKRLNSYTGTTTVAGGTLTIEAASNLGDGDVVVANGALLRLLGTGNTDVIADDASVTLQQFGLFNGKIELAGTETIGALYLGDQLLAAGDYTAASEGMSQYLSGTGTLHVVPEPATLGAMAVGLLALLRRQRRA